MQMFNGVGLLFKTDTHPHSHERCVWCEPMVPFWNVIRPFLQEKTFSSFRELNEIELLMWKDHTQTIFLASMKDRLMHVCICYDVKTKKRLLFEKMINILHTERKEEREKEWNPFSKVIRSFHRFTVMHNFLFSIKLNILAQKAHIHILPMIYQ